MKKLISSHPECVEVKRDKIIVCLEKSRKISFLNSQEAIVYRIRIDDCVIKEGKKCDFGLIPCDDVEIYIELKGDDLAYATKQIESTIFQVSSNPKAARKLCFVICSKVSPPKTDVQNHKSYFIRKFNAKLRIKCVKDEFDLIDCC